MSSVNPFAVASSTTSAPAAPVADQPAATETPNVTADQQVDDLIAAATGEEGGKKRKKSDKPRKPRNRTITEEDKKVILARYHNEATGDIARSLGLTRAQVYNVVRNTRKELEKFLENPELPEDAKNRINAALAKLPKKEGLGGGATGPRKQQTLDDILAGFGL
jgi:predicted DNA-binding protein YlxM (UPF0122 family)